MTVNTNAMELILHLLNVRYFTFYKKILIACLKQFLSALSNKAIVKALKTKETLREFVCDVISVMKDNSGKQTKNKQT